VSEPSPQRFEHHLEFRLSPGSTTAALMRLVSVLHSRGAEVVALHYRPAGDGGNRVSATVLVTPERARTLLLSFDRVVGILDVAVMEHEARSA
jgi:acetolactate synthase regulatory subunit